MHPKVKVVILGLSNSGKSSVAAILKKKDWFIVEVDDIAQYKNNGVWPEDEDVLDTLFKEVNDEVIKLDNVIFVTSFLELDDIKKFREKEFKIIELHADYEVLKRRKVKRDGAPKDKYERYNRNYNYYQKMLPTIEKYFSLSLDSTKTPPEKLADIVETFIATNFT